MLIQKGLGFMVGPEIKGAENNQTVLEEAGLRSWKI